MNSDAKAQRRVIVSGGYGPWCPKCHRFVDVYERVCFGPNQGNTYWCHWCAWRGRDPVYGERCENTWPDYEPRWPIDPPHPLACACSGRGYYPPGRNSR